jgi:hypothetical protein
MTMAELEQDAGGEGDLPEFFRHQRDAGGQARLDLRLQGMTDLAAVTVDGSARWVSIGPAPLVIDGDQIYQGKGPDGGVVGDIAVDPSGDTDAVIYVASGYGGVWKSEDGGVNWLPTMDLLPSLSIGALALESGTPSTLYAGVGTLFNLKSQQVRFAGAGLYKSVDSGASWCVADGGPNATSFEGLDINRIVSPQRGMVFVGTSAGLYFSTDGGQNFGTNFPDYNNGKAIEFPDVPHVRDATITALAPDTTAPATKVWVALSGHGIFRVTKLGAGTDLVISANLFTKPGAPAPGTFSDIAFAQGRNTASAATADQTLYASVQQIAADNSASFVGLFKSTDGGENWAVTPAAGLPARLGATGADQSDYDFMLGIDPQDAARVYAGFKELWRSADIACTFPEATSCGASQIHWDQHAIAFSPPSHWGSPAAFPTPVYAGNDGGLVRSTDGGSNWNSLNGGVATTLFYCIDIGRGSAANNAYTYGGAQDTGTEGHRPGDAGLEWHSGQNGDGSHVAVDRADPRIVYGFSNEFLIRTTDGGAHWLLAARPQAANISGATNASPIVITAVAHGFVSGELVTITGVLGNTAANGVWVITTDPAKPNEFSLFGSAGNAVYTSGGSATQVARADIDITGASNASPIVITVANHPFQNNDNVNISGVVGNTAANGQFVVTRISDQSFSLNGSAGNGNYVSGGVARGPGIGRGLSAPAGEFRLRRVGLVANGASPADIVFVSEEAVLYRSADRGVSFTPVTAIPAGDGDATITALTVHDASHLWVGLANGSVHFSADSGAKWDTSAIKTRPGPAREVSAIAVDPADPLRVAVGFSGYAEVNPLFRTGSCFISANGGGSWSDASGTEANVEGNLPDLPLHDVVFDSSTMPSTLIAATDGAVLASADSGAHWRVLGVGLPAVSCLSLAIDNGATPRVIRTGTYGRGAFELNRPTDARIVVEGSFGFGPVQTQKSKSQAITLRNPGAVALTVKSIQRLAGSVEFSLQDPSMFPPIPPHGSQEIKVLFQPGDVGVYAAEFMIDNGDPSQGLLSVFASGEAVAAGPPRLAIKANLRFGRTNSDKPRELAIELSTPGDTAVKISSISRSSGSSDFALVGDWSVVPTVDPGATVFATVRFSPGSNGPLAAEFKIESDDARAPQRIVKAQGVGVSAGSDALKIILIIIGVAAAAAIGVGVAYAVKKKL